MGGKSRQAGSGWRWWIPSSPSDLYLATGSSQVNAKGTPQRAGPVAWGMPTKQEKAKVTLKVATPIPSDAVDFQKDSFPMRLLEGPTNWPSDVGFHGISFLLILTLYLHLILSRLQSGQQKRKQKKTTKLLEQELRNSKSTIGNLEAHIHSHQQQNWEQELRQSRSAIANLQAQVQIYQGNGHANWKEEKETMVEEMERLQTKIKEQAEYLKQTLVMHDIPNAQYELVETRAELQQERQRNKVLTRNLEAWKSQAKASKEEMGALKRMREIDLSMISSLTSQGESNKSS